MRVVVVVLTASALLALGVRLFVITACRISSSSMAPTLLAGDRVLVNRAAFLFGSPRRGDVVAFRRGERLVVKRCTAGPGDSVRLADGRAMRLTGPEGVPADEQLWFLTGDSAEASLDSRFYGPVPAGDIVGNVMVVFWSTDGEDPLAIRWARIGMPVR
jgi:signal peptidase I